MAAETPAPGPDPNRPKTVNGFAMGIDPVG